MTSMGEQASEGAARGSAPALKASLLVRWIEDDLALHDPETDTTLVLNASAGRIVELLDGSRIVADIAGELEQELSGNQDVGLAVTRVIEELSRQGFLDQERPSA